MNIENIKDFFFHGYRYGWENNHAWFGNTYDSKSIDDHIDNGVLAGKKDKNANKEYNPENAWNEYFKNIKQLNNF
jgi:hypothetical protein